LSPKYPADQLVYVYYTTAHRQTGSPKFRLGEQPRPIFTGYPKAGNHNGGRIAFGPDGMLYAGTGDAGVEYAIRRTADTSAGNSPPERGR